MAFWISRCRVDRDSTPGAVSLRTKKKSEGVPFPGLQKTPAAIQRGTDRIADLFVWMMFSHWPDQFW